MQGSITAVPMACDTNLLCVVHHLDQDAFEQKSDDGLTLLLSGRLGTPERGQILREIADREKFGRAWRLQPFAASAFVVCLQLRLLGQSLLPGPLK